MEFAEKLITLRKSRELTQEQLAEQLNVSRQSISKWESGHKHLDTTIKYLDWLDDELIEASNEFYAQHTAIYGAERLLE